MEEKPTLKKKVEEWLAKQGYPLEMRVAQVLKQRGWLVLHSRRYNDPIQQKEREIDLLAISDDPSESSSLAGDLVIECKWTRDKPWVLFSGTKLATNAIAQLAATPKTSGAMAKIPYDEVPTLPLFENVDEGYSLVQALKTEKTEDPTNVGYTAVQTVINAADFFASQMSEELDILFVPVVVIDGELFRGTLSEKGEVVIDPIEFGVLSHLRAIEGPRFVHIVRESALTDFISRAERTFALIRSAVANTRQRTRVRVVPVTSRRPKRSTRRKKPSK
jgi:hypothetical protein